MKIACRTRGGIMNLLNEYVLQAFFHFQTNKKKKEKKK